MKASSDSKTVAARLSRGFVNNRLVFMLIVPLLVVLAAAVVYLKTGRYVETDNAYIQADKVQVSPQVAGNVIDVIVQENQPVTKGQVLFILDPAPYQVAVQRAEANLAQVRTNIVALQASYHEKMAEISLAKSQYAYQIREQKRQKDLLDKHYISEANYDAAKQNTDIARLKLQADKEALKQIAASLAGSVDVPVEQHPNYLTALAELHQSKLDLSRTEVKASMTGTVHVPPKPGQYLQAGQTAMTLVVDNNLWIEANFTENDLTHVQPGQTVSISVDTYPDVQWRGEVESLSPATSAEFSVLPAQNATGNWVKIAQRLPVRIKILPLNDGPTLRAGMSVETKIDTHHKRTLFGWSL